MSYSFFAHQDLNFPVAGAVVANVPADDATPSWERLTGEIQRLFKVAIAAASEGVRGKTRIVIAAERILDAAAAMALIAEIESDERRARLSFGLDQCETEAQRLFDACMDGQQEAVLCAYAERGLMAAYGLTDTPVVVSH
jgi:hypothetical protein